MPSSKPESNDSLFSRFVTWQKDGILSQGGVQWRNGLVWALLSPLFLGTIPILAKVAYGVGVDVMTVVAFRTLFASGMLWLFVYIFKRSLIITSPLTLYSSLAAGIINGIGSLFFYASLTRIDASLGQLLNITYLIYVTLLLRLFGQRISRLTVFRMGLAIFSIYLLTVGALGQPDWVGVGMMIFASLTFAIQLVFSQRILVDSPAPTVALYIMSGMALVVTIAWLLFPTDLTLVSVAGWEAIIAMGVVTGLSRLTMFLGVKNLGSLQTALLSVLEVVVSIGLAYFFLDESLTGVQWIGTLILIISILLVRYERNVPKFVDWWQLFWKWRLKQK